MVIGANRAKSLNAARDREMLGFQICAADHEVTLGAGKESDLICCLLLIATRFGNSVMTLQVHRLTASAMDACIKRVGVCLDVSLELVAAALLLPLARADLQMPLYVIELRRMMRLLVDMVWLSHMFPTMERPVGLSGLREFMKLISGSR